MRIEIHIRDTKKNGARVGMRNAFVESVFVYKEAGDGLRLDNLAEPARVYFLRLAVELVNAWKDGVRGGNKSKTSDETSDCDTCQCSHTQAQQVQTRKRTDKE